MNTKVRTLLLSTAIVLFSTCGALAEWGGGYGGTPQPPSSQKPSGGWPQGEHPHPRPPQGGWEGGEYHPRFPGDIVLLPHPHHPDYDDDYYRRPHRDRDDDYYERRERDRDHYDRDRDHYDRDRDHYDHDRDRDRY